MKKVFSFIVLIPYIVLSIIELIIIFSSVILGEIWIKIKKGLTTIFNRL
jgi:hypothetical protein